jgi:hypothetical protein
MSSLAKPSHNRVIVLDRDTYNRARSRAPELLTDPFTLVVPVPLRAPWDADPKLRAIAELMQPGALLLRNRLAGPGYLDSAVAYERLSVANFNLVAEICQLLGASRLEVKEIRELTDSGKVTASVRFQGGATTGGSGSLGSEWLNRLAQSIQGRWVWGSGGQADIAAAEAHAGKYGLDGDPVVSGLIRQRGYAANALAEHVLELDISSEAQRQVQAALKVESLLKKLGPSFDGTFDHLRKQSHQLRLRVQVTFGPVTATEEDAG